MTTIFIKMSIQPFLNTRFIPYMSVVSTFDNDNLTICQIINRSENPNKFHSLPQFVDNFFIKKKKRTIFCCQWKVLYKTFYENNTFCIISKRRKHMKNLWYCKDVFHVIELKETHVVKILFKDVKEILKIEYILYYIFIYTVIKK